MTAPQKEPAGSEREAPKYWCETCEGTGSVYQEHQAGCHVGGDYPCPDCDGKGYWTPRASLASPSSGGWQWVPVEPTDAMTWAGQQARYPVTNSITVIYREMLAAAPKSGDKSHG